MSLPDTIETERLILRPFKISDSAAVLGYANNKNFGRFLPPVPYPYTQKDADEFIARRILEDGTKSKTWGVTLKPADGSADAPIGGLSMRFNKDHNVAEMGWSIAEDHWGKGIVTEGVQALIDATFTHLPNMHKLRAGAFLRNVGSWRVMEKVGMRREAHYREHEFVDGEWLDDVWYGILRSDWDKSQK